MNAEGRKGLAVTDAGASLELDPQAKRLYVYNSGASYVYLDANGSASDLVTAVAANEAYPLAPKASTKQGIFEQRTIRSLQLATASGESSTVDLGWY